MKVKSISTRFGWFSVGGSWTIFGIGLRVDRYGISGDFLFFWFSWER